VIALDTNILLRYVLQDDEQQSPVATALIEEQLSADAPGFVSLVVVCELVWALRRSYGLPKERIAEFMRAVVNSVQIAAEHRHVILTALGARGDLADAIIHALGAHHGCTHTLTFDRKFARIDGVELLG
jgi:predicted nucleic-acid-binding protein